MRRIQTLNVEAFCTLFRLDDTPDSSATFLYGLDTLAMPFLADGTLMNPNRLFSMFHRYLACIIFNLDYFDASAGTVSIAVAKSKAGPWIRPGSSS